MPELLREGNSLQRDRLNQCSSDVELPPPGAQLRSSTFNSVFALPFHERVLRNRLKALPISADWPAHSIARVEAAKIAISNTEECIHVEDKQRPYRHLSLAYLRERSRFFLAKKKENSLTQLRIPIGCGHAQETPLKRGCGQRYLIVEESGAECRL